MLRDRLLLQKRELDRRNKEYYISRDITLSRADIPDIIIGPRRAGKSTAAIHLLRQKRKHKRTFAYCNFDDEMLIGLTNYDDLVAELRRLYNNPKTFLFDEIQNLPKWELFVNRLQRQGYKLIITGSNAHLLSKELATHLTGRHRQLILFPFSFKEFLKLLDEKEENLTTAEVKSALGNYLQHGGYPEPLVKKLDHEEYLRTLYTSIIYKDIVKRMRIRSVQGMEDLAQYFFSNVAKEFSYNTLSKITKCKSVHTVEKYLHYLEEAFLFFRVARFSYKMKEQVSFNKKVYCIDNGLITANGINFSKNKGRLYENVVAIELFKRELGGHLKMFYWKNQQQEEIDFVIKEGLKVKQLIQVCYDLSEPKTVQREIRVLLKGSKELRCNNLLVITTDEEKEETAEWFGIKRKVKYIPLWKWLLKGAHP